MGDIVSVPGLKMTMMLHSSVWFAANHSGTYVRQSFKKVNKIKARNTNFLSPTCFGFITRKLTKEPW